MNNPLSASPVPTKVSINFWIASFHAKPATKPNAVVTNILKKQLKLAIDYKFNHKKEIHS